MRCSFSSLNIISKWVMKGVICFLQVVQLNEHNAKILSYVIVLTFYSFFITICCQIQESN